MNRKSTLYLVIVLFLGWLTPVASQVINPGRLKDFCASEEEVKLYNLINEYRRIHKLPAIPFSRSLSYVARIHTMDLSYNRPDFGGCNPHSWSAKGVWKPCCYSQDKNRLLCMNEKPKEITGYKFKGWEMVYSDGEEAHAEDVLDLWKDIGLTNDYLLNTGKWVKPWKALGIGFFGEYASVWFGEGDDAEKGFGICNHNSVGNQTIDTIQQLPEQAPETVQVSDNDVNNAGLWYIVVASLNTADKAETEIARLKQMGYSKATVLPWKNYFRIAVSDFKSGKEAEKALSDLQNAFPGAWILKPTD